MKTATLRLTYRTRGHVHLPSPPIAVCRGQVGAFLRAIDSEQRHAQGGSLYQRLFRTPRTTVGVPPLPGRLLGALGLTGEHVPHPFVMRFASAPSPGDDVRMVRGDTFETELTLVEGAVAHLAELAAAAEALGADGLGRKTRQPSGRRARGRTRLERATLEVGPLHLTVYADRQWQLPADTSTKLYEEAEQAAARLRPTSSPLHHTPSGETPPEEGAPEEGAPGEEALEEAALLVTFRTPLRIKHAGAIVRPETLTLDALAANLFRRVAGLAVCYGPGGGVGRGGGGADELVERLATMRSAFEARSAACHLEASGVEWVDDARYSHRQERRHPTAGLIGALTIRGPRPHVRAWRNWFKATEPLHLGKKTSMGLGQLRVGPLRATSEPEPQQNQRQQKRR